MKIFNNSSDEGPECPNCGEKYVADETYYFDESGFTMKCQGCDKVLHVQPHNTTSWTTTIPDQEPDATKK